MLPDCVLPAEMLFRDHYPIHSQGTFFLFCTESLVDSNYGAVDLLNSTVIALCTMLPARMLSRDHFCQWLPFTADGHFSVPLEWYQSKPGSHEDGSYVNSSSAVNVMRLLGMSAKIRVGTFPYGESWFHSWSL